MSTLKMLVLSAMLAVVGWIVLPLTAHAQISYRACRPAGDCSAVYGQTVCPVTPEFPAGLCTRCANTELQNWTCSGLPTENPCYQEFPMPSCGIMQAGVCVDGTCQDYQDSTQTCGMQKWCDH